jgi:hypothetical protein
MAGRSSTWAQDLKLSEVEVAVVLGEGRDVVRGD